MKNALFIFADGGSRGNPGPAAIGFIIRDSTGKILAKKGKSIGRTTNNVAEYTAVIEALREVTKLQSDKVAKINFFLDSKLVVNQLNGLFKIKNSRLRNLIVEARQLERKVGGNISYHFIPREKNRAADALVNQALNNS